MHRELSVGCSWIQKGNTWCGNLVCQSHIIGAACITQPVMRLWNVNILYKGASCFRLLSPNINTLFIQLPNGFFIYLYFLLMNAFSSSQHLPYRNLNAIVRTMINGWLKINIKLMKAIIYELIFCILSFVLTLIDKVPYAFTSLWLTA